MAKKVVEIVNKNGKKVRLLNPSQKGKKFSLELQGGTHLDNYGRQKADKNGKPKRITDTEAAWRSGYLAAQSDSAKCYNHNQNKKSGKNQSGKF